MRHILTLITLAVMLMSVPSFAQTSWDQLQQQLIEKEQFKQRELAGALHLREVVNKRRGHSVHYIQQRVDGIRVHNAILNVIALPDGKVVHINDRFLHGIERMVAGGQPQLTVEQALQFAASHLKLTISDMEMLQQASGQDQQGMLSKSGISSEDIPFNLVYVKVNESEVRLAWELVIRANDNVNWWQIRVDAANGTVLEKDNWISTCEFDNETHDHTTHCVEHVSAGRNPMLTPAAPLLANSYNVYAEPFESPYNGGRTLQASPWNNNLSASPFGWHDTDGASGAEYTITRGNNVWASEDRDNDNVPGFSPDGGATLDFDFPLDLTQEPVNYQAAAITNLFYWNNLIHDVMYNYGFDEQSGNFQVNNYGNGGLGNDEVIADAQDGSGLNNANFGTPPDGQQPRMQMFEWDIAAAPSITVDGTGYNGVVAAFGPQVGTWTGDLIVADDGTANPTEACSALVGTGYAGKIVLIDRGNCNFTDKVLNAENEGAIGVIVAQNTGDAPFGMGGVDPGLTIPSVMISQADGNTIKAAIAAGTISGTISLLASVNRDSDLDNGVITHEYGHGISTRLTAGADNVGCLFNNEQMGEGWSDYFGLIMTMDAADFGAEARGIGNYSIGAGINGPGIRPFPYSTDMSVNPFTYQDINSVSIPHGVGSVWCTMLWDMTWLLIDEYGYDPDLYNGTGGNNIALELVVEGLKLQPCSPGFVDGRDAILLADELLNGGVNKCLIWEAFARRGLGVNADQGSSSDVNDSVESFDVSGDCAVGISKTSSDTIEANGTMTVTLDIFNNTGGLVTNVVVTDLVPSDVDYVPGSASCTVTAVGNDLTFDLGDLPDGATIQCTYEVSAPATPFSIIEFQDNLESGVAGYTVTNNIPGFDWSVSTTRANSPSNSWFASDPGQESDQYLVLPNVTNITASTFLSFWHFYNTEANWDGGVLETSTDGTTWVDAEALITQNGYNSTLNVNPASALSGQNAWSGGSGGFIQTIVDLSSFTGQTISIRWRLASDNFVAAEGWYVDDIFIGEALVDFTNTACVVSDQTISYCSSQYTQILEQTCTPVTWYEDSDTDGFGNDAVSISACIQPAGYISDNTDCDDTRDDVYPNAPGTAEGVDNNCNGSIDATECLPLMWYADTDSDGFGDAASSLTDCDQPAGYVADDTDCDDTNGDVYPNAPGTAEGIDNNCNGSIDASECIQLTWYADTDNDGFGDVASSLSDCAQPAGYVADNTDCDDTNGDVYPNAPGTGEGIDNNCNGSIDAFECIQLTWYADTDNDGFGDAASSLSDCAQPAGYVADNTDCDDTNGDVYPNAPGTGEDIDNNCNGSVEGDEVYSCLGDFNFDGFINVTDLLMFLGDFGCNDNCLADMNNDGLVNSTDMLVFLGVFDTACP
ncbi:MAG: T9SS-dependent M36 family metallopeptidase [Flavobacteriales bacterium]|nr:T9SS-dependent M36 family metallopeptidase [Flavobacteriales bacterium]MDG2247359.1 T9SS-dependent M36 family metallopeptidase [Flavobacteriales bacterium]